MKKLISCRPNGAAWLFFSSHIAKSLHTHTHTNQEYLGKVPRKVMFVCIFKGGQFLPQTHLFPIICIDEQRGRQTEGYCALQLMLNTLKNGQLDKPFCEGLNITRL